MHLFFYFRLLAFLLLNLANKITDGNPLKTKLDIFIEVQGATSVESLWKGATDHESLRATALDQRSEISGYSIATACNILSKQLRFSYAVKHDKTKKL